MRLPEFSAYRPALLRHAEVAASEQAWLAVEPPPGFAAAHLHAGQFCKMRVAGREGIFAMYSAPGEAEARFLVRVGNPVGGEAADALAELPDATPIEMTMPAGDGFDLGAARGLDVRFVATGTAVAPVRAALESVLAERGAFGALSLDLGLRSEGHLAIGAELTRWQAEGVEVRLCYSHLDPAGALVGTTVQGSLEAHVPDLTGGCVVAVGQPEMLRELSAVVLRLGGEGTKLLTNV